MSTRAKLTSGDHAMIEQIINRCHVGESNLAVVRYLLSRMKPGSWKLNPRPLRRAVLRYAVKHHAHNRGFYRDVMSGNI